MTDGPVAVLAHGLGGSSDLPIPYTYALIGNPFDHLPSLPVRPGTVTVLAVLLGSTAFDSFSAVPVWRNFVDRQTDSAATATLMRTGGLLVFIAVVVVTFWFAARATGGVDKNTRGRLPGLMAHSLIPIVLGYVFAHYLSYLIERGQLSSVRGMTDLLFGHDFSHCPYTLTRCRATTPLNKL